MSEKPSEEKKNIFDAMPENPALAESPWKPGSPCTFALFGKNQPDHVHHTLERARRTHDLSGKPGSPREERLVNSQG
uniref:Uncharacterized protein n=1 Tax=uncultured bacterium A1Q1_fos_25 TaxID=1256569 RepID=L7VXZ4_9BACT|nr:hypothetical protein [uncultured bacterium A1Q1_fos_25]